MSRIPPPRSAWLASGRPVPRLIARPLRAFLETEVAGGIVLLAAAAFAFAWANSPFADSYEALWTTKLGVSVGPLRLSQDLRHWVNDGLMAIFFFVVGLEIKRELVVGELSDRMKASLPIIAAVGGMVVPALLYVSLNASGNGSSGWGIPMATDIAFAIGLLALLGDRVPSGLKVFLLSLAIVDDIGAILVIALFYAESIDLSWLAAAFLGLLAIAGLRRARVHWVPLYAAVGLGVWLATLESGVHATIAGVALGFLAPARPADPGGFGDVMETAAGLSDEPDAESLRAISLQANETVSVAERLGHLLHPWSSFLIVPLFALANAGVEVGGDAAREALGSRVTLGIVLGLVVGKLMGVFGASWLAIRLGIATAPEGVGLRHLLGAAAAAGIGFTVSLFISTLAFGDPGLVAAAKIGVFAASCIAGVLGAAILWTARPSMPPDEG